MGCDVEPPSLVQGKAYTVATASFEATLLRKGSREMALRLLSDGVPRDLAMPLWFAERFCTFVGSDLDREGSHTTSTGKLAVAHIAEAEVLADEQLCESDDQDVPAVEAPGLRKRADDANKTKACEEFEAVPAAVEVRESGDQECEEPEPVAVVEPAAVRAAAPTSTNATDPPAEDLLEPEPEVAHAAEEERSSELGVEEAGHDTVAALVESEGGLEEYAQPSLAAGMHPGASDPEEVPLSACLPAGEESPGEESPGEVTAVFKASADPIASGTPLDDYSPADKQELTRRDTTACEDESTDASVSDVTAMLDTWRRDPAAVAEVSDGTLKWIHREGSLSDRADVVIFFANRWEAETLDDGSLRRWTVSFQSVIAFLDGVRSRLQQLDRASERANRLFWSLIEMYRRCFPRQSSLTSDFRDRVLLPLACVGFNGRHASQLLGLLDIFVYRYLDREAMNEQIRTLCTRSFIRDFFFRIVKWGPEAHLRVSECFQGLFSNGALTSSARKEILWQSGIKEFFTALALAADKADDRDCDTVCLAIFSISNDVYDDVVFERPLFPGGFCPLLDDAEFFKTSVFPLFRHRPARALELLPAVIQSLRSEYFASPEFRDCVLLPNISKTMTDAEQGTIIEVLDAVLHCDCDHAQLRDVFASTKCLARCFSVILKRARDVVGAIRRKRQRSKEALKRIDKQEDEHDTARLLRVSSAATATFSLLRQLLGLPAPLVGDGPDRACATPSEGSHGWRGADTPAWGSPVLFNDVIVPFLALAPLTNHAELFDVVRAFWARRPTFVTAEQLRDTVILPLVRTDVDVDPLLFMLLSRADDATAEGAAFKDAFAAPAAFMIFDKQGPVPREPTLVARCLLLTVRDGAVLNGRRADALSAVCRRLLRVNHDDIGWNKYCPIAMLLVAMTGRAPGEAENATIARHAALCDRLVLPKFLDLIVQDRAPESEQFLFRGLRLAMRNSDEEARHKILSHTVLPFGHGALMATIKRIASAADAEHCLDVLAAGGRDLRDSHVAEYLSALAPMCTTAEAAGAMACCVDSFVGAGRK